MKKRKLFLCIILAFVLALGIAGSGIILSVQTSAETKQQGEISSEAAGIAFGKSELDDPASRWNTDIEKITVLFENKKFRRQNGTVRIGIAWRSDTGSEFYVNVRKAVEAAGGEAVALGEVMCLDFEYTKKSLASGYIAEENYLLEEYAELVKKNTYANSNIKEVMEKADVDAVIFSGGKDISPTLIADSSSWKHIKGKKDYDATRDVSDYLLMAYCIDNDIPVLGICRGMQMLAIVSGGTIIQDIPAFYKRHGLTYSNEHSNVKVTGTYRDYASHDISITTRQSIIYDIYGSYTVENVPSWHHQAVYSVENTSLKVTATTQTGGYDIIEAIERIDKSLIIGLQFHPEAAMAKVTKKAKNASDYMGYDEALKAFEYLVEYVKWDQ